MHVRVRIIVFFNDTATTEIYTYLHTLSLHDALPIYGKLSDCWNLFHWSTASASGSAGMLAGADCGITLLSWVAYQRIRSEEHTSELQSLMRNSYAVFCLKTKNNTNEVNKSQTISKMQTP